MLLFDLGLLKSLMYVWGTNCYQVSKGGINNVGGRLDVDGKEILF